MTLIFLPYILESSNDLSHFPFVLFLVCLLWFLRFYYFERIEGNLFAELILFTTFAMSLLYIPFLLMDLVFNFLLW